LTQYEADWATIGQWDRIRGERGLSGRAYDVLAGYRRGGDTPFSRD